MTDRPAIPRPGRPRHARLLVAILVLALAAAACSGGGGDGADGGQDAAAGYDPKAPVSITWWTGQTADAQTLPRRWPTRR
jgi:multiple sugar transport system substrate-binding protein